MGYSTLLDCLQKIIAETGAVYLFGYQNPDPVSASLIGHHRLRHGLGIYQPLLRCITVLIFPQKPDLRQSML